jgi:hypothetical protein
MSGHYHSSRFSRRKRQTARQPNAKDNTRVDEPEASNAWNQPVDQSGWDVEDTTYLDPKTMEHQTRVDGLSGLILFWRTGVHAAERGEQVFKMEKFYEEQDALALAQEQNGGWGLIRPDQDPWGVSIPHQDPWGVAATYGGWGKGGWPEQESNSGHGGGWGSPHNSEGTQQEKVVGNDLVSKFAQDARPERREQLYEFLKVSLVSNLSFGVFDALFSSPPTRKWKKYSP